MIRLLLVDDETLAVDRLRGLLDHFADIEVVGSVHSGDAALEQAAVLRPDAILLDVEMPILDGFDVVEELARLGGAKPLIIFVTAFPRFAASAFDTGAIDFLTKPVRLTRLEAAMDRLRRAIEDRTANDRLRELAGQLEALRQERGGAGIHAPNHLWVRCRGEAVRVDLDRLECIEAEGEYVRLVTGEASYLHRASVTAMMERLNPQRFLRIHRSYIIDRNRIVSVRRRATGGYELLTDSGRTLPVGRNYRTGVRDILADRTNPRDNKAAG